MIKNKQTHTLSKHTSSNLDDDTTVMAETHVPILNTSCMQADMGLVSSAGMGVMFEDGASGKAVCPPRDAELQHYVRLLSAPLSLAGVELNPRLCFDW